jgi:opacity protein-like surface antigen
MSYHPIQLTLTAALAIISIDTATAQDLSALKMSFSEQKISILPEQITPQLDPKPSIAQNVRRDDRQTGTGWYFGTTRGVNFPSLTATNSEGNKANWNGIDFNNFNGLAGYKSSNFRIEGELLYASNNMTIDRNTKVPIIGDTKTDGQQVQQVQPKDGVPVNCKATTFAAILNGYYDIDTGGQIKPFVGAGIGYASTNLKDSGLDWGSKSGFTYQFKVGVGYLLSDRQDIYVQYKYINAPAQYVKQDKTPFSSTDFSSGSIEIGTKFNF